VQQSFELQSLPKPNKKKVYKTLNSFFPTLDFNQDSSQVSKEKILLRASFTFRIIPLAPCL